MSVIELESRRRMMSSSMIESFIRVIVEPSETSDPEKLGALWTVELYETDRMFIQMEFEDKIFVSSGIDPDSVELQFKSEQIFFDLQGQALPSDTALERFIPVQLSEDTATQTLEASGETVGKGS